MNDVIREATAADYPAVAAVLTAANPRHPVSVEALEASAKKTRQHPKGLHLAQWVAEQNGEIVGFAGVAQWAGSFHPDRYHAQLAVPPQLTRQGIGTRLAQTVREHLQTRNAREVQAGAYEDDPHAIRFLERRGFREVAREFDNVLTLSEYQPDRWEQERQVPQEYRLVSLEQFTGEQGEDAALNAFLTVFNEARADEPRTTPAQPYTLDEIRAYTAHPSALPHGIVLVVTDAGEVAALSELWRDLTDPTRLNTGLTGTARHHRRRGLALAAKLAGLELARQHGARTVWTSNASTNVPMLAINTHLGFKPEPAFIEMQWGSVE